MELFSEIYSSYYRAVEKVLRQAQERPLNVGELHELLSDCTFCESTLTILPKLQSGAWPLIQKTELGYAAVCAPLPENPLTNLQRAWLSAILCDSRISLFFNNKELLELRRSLSDVKPLYQQEDFYLFDQARDGDNYDNPDYQSRFRAFLTAIREKTALRIHYESGKSKRLSSVFWPFRLEYSQKDDKFRAYCYGKSGTRKMLYTLNLGRIVSLEPADQVSVESASRGCVHPVSRFKQVVLEITKERNALERSLVQFAHFEKRTEYDESTDKYVCTIRYNVMDETEVVIRVLSFGPTVRAIGPDAFLDEIKERVRKQSELLGSALVRRDSGGIIG